MDNKNIVLRSLNSKFALLKADKYMLWGVCPFLLILLIKIGFSTGGAVAVTALTYAIKQAIRDYMQEIREVVANLCLKNWYDATKQ